MLHEGIGIGERGRTQGARHAAVFPRVVVRIPGILERGHVAPRRDVRRPHLSESVDDFAPPAAIEGRTVHIRGGGVRTREGHGIHIEGQLATRHRPIDDVVVVDHRQHAARGIGTAVDQQTAEVIERRGEVIALAHTLQIDRIDAVGLQKAVELVEAAEGVVALDRDIPAEAPPRREREQTAGLHAAAPAVELRIRRARERVHVLIDTCDLDIVRAADVAPVHPMPPLTLPEHALARGVHRVEREVVVRREREIVGNAKRRAEGIGVAVLRREEARAPLHRRIGVREPRHIENRDAEELERRILIGDRAGLLVVGDAGGADAPERRAAAVGPARCEAALLELGDVAFATYGAARRDAGVVTCRHAQRLDESLAEVIRRGELVRAHDVAVRLLELRIALCGERLRTLVVDDAIGCQNVVVEHDLDVADRDDAIVGRVVDELIALQIERRGAIHLGGRPAEDAAFGLLELLLLRSQVANRIVDANSGAARERIGGIARGARRRCEEHDRGCAKPDQGQCRQDQARAQPKRLARSSPSRLKRMPRYFHLSRPPGATAPSTTRTTPRGPGPIPPSWTA